MLPELTLYATERSIVVASPHPKIPGIFVFCMVFTTRYPPSLNSHPNSSMMSLAFTSIGRAAYIAFSGMDVLGATTDVTVLLNGTSWFSDELNYNGNGNSASFLGTVTMNAGDTLDFRVGAGIEEYFFDTTGLEAIVVCVPEPSSALLGAAAAGLLALRRRRA